MRRAGLSGRVRALEDRAAQKDPHGPRLRALFAWLGAAREARQTGSPAKEEAARVLRLEALAHAGQS